MGGVRATVQTLHAVQKVHKVKVLALLFLVAIYSPLGNVSCAPLDQPKNNDDSYLPREIAPDEGFVDETAPAMPSRELSPPPLQPASVPAGAPITPNELPYFGQVVSEDQVSKAQTTEAQTTKAQTTEAQTNDEQANDVQAADDQAMEDQVAEDQAYYNYQLPLNQEDQDYQSDQEDNVGIDLNFRPPSETNMPSYWPLSNEPSMKQLFGPKSKFFYDKDQVGIPGKENRFRRRAGEGTGSSGSYSQSSASSSSGPNFFSNQAFPAFDSRFSQSFGGVGAGAGVGGLAGFDSYGGSSLYDAGYGGYSQDQGQGYGGSAASSSALGGGLGGGPDTYGAGLGYGGGVPEYSHSTYGTDGFGYGGDERVGVQSRLGGGGGGGGVGGGGDDVTGVGARINISAQGQNRGVFSAASSSIDGNGKTTHMISAGEIKK